MDERDIKYVSAFLKELQEESDRGAALVGAALLDARLERLLLAHMLPGKVTTDLINGRNAPLGTFSARINACYALGLITISERHDLNLVRAVRNEFAHREHGITFSDEKIAGLCTSLNSRRPPNIVEDMGGYPPRQRFNDAVIFTAMQLWHRPEHAEPFKAEERQWPY
ncbi:MltR family transcriptional regulator [Burkholderia sp. Ac-20353]|uniref:MltR family transcriptional regulator n=1 Tax=Burkholderia sp. Ac-20353 TaxID=2703894 RepID=UPI00197BE3C1|nr:MltR family transcriptional regulator [Burkholderia sp. Ac-20353]MBN3786188.1 transcriptional regulator [Burkholderia sp. Ac-20353]